MNEQAIIDSYILFKKDGYLKSFQEFKQLIATNSDALNYSYELFKKDGYTKSLNDYKILMGVTSQSLEPNPNPAPTTNVFDCLLKDPDLKFVKSHNYKMLWSSFQDH